MFIGKIQHSAKTSPLQKKGPCWKNYEMVGMKTKGGKKVPNCVPVKMEGDVLDGPLKKKREKKEKRKTYIKRMKLPLLLLAIIQILLLALVLLSL